MPIGAATSNDVSRSIGTTSHDASPRPAVQSVVRSESHAIPTKRSPVSAPSQFQPVEGELGSTHDGGITRGMATLTEKVPMPRGPHERFEYGLLPRVTSGPIAANSLCCILHPDHRDIIVAEGRSGGSWKSHSAKFGSLCEEGEQMVQIHKIIKPNVSLLFIEERQPFTVLEHALVKPHGSSVYVK